ncbi:MAG: membrane or secreted protein [Bacteroidetes bacterium]|nr:membrane or secreted protein [Bacteroidota bacterium]
MKLIYYLISPVLYFFAFKNSPEISLPGAWKQVSGNLTTVVLLQDGYFTSTTYTPESFKETRGGVYKVEGNNILVHQEYNTAEKELKTEIIPFKLINNKLHINDRQYEQLDNGQASLAGVWKITGRMVDGTINELQQRGTRKTLKLLTGTRFHWFAIDPDGNKFSGTGGGTYTFRNGKYTENIEFFSRDSSRIGVSLTFDDHLDNGKWHHTGLSSKGDKIYEIWEKVPSVFPGMNAQ